MRDERIYQMQEANARRCMLLLKQFEFVQTKIQAYEEILSTPWARFMAIISPSKMHRRIDNRQIELLAECKKKYERAAASAPPKPSILVPAGVR